MNDDSAIASGPTRQSGLKMQSRDQEWLILALKSAAREVNRINVDKGWHDSSRTFGDEIALLHSEVSEALEAFRDYGLGEKGTMPSYYEIKQPSHGSPGETITKQVQDLGSWQPGSAVVGKPIGVASEFADVLVRLLDTCHRYNIDLGTEFLKKITFNDTRPARHGGKAL